MKKTDAELRLLNKLLDAKQDIIDHQRDMIEGYQKVVIPMYTKRVLKLEQQIKELGGHVG